MAVKKVYSKVLVGMMVVLSLTLLSSCTNSSEEKGKIKIGISQIIEHPALDASRKGFLDALSSKGYIEGDKISAEFKNAQGDIPTTQSIAQNFVSGKKDLILAIGTPSAQSAFNATKEIPILITAVTDPVEAGIVKSMEFTKTNVTGTSDFVSTEKQFKLLVKLVPKAKNVGVLYNTSEINSEAQVKEIKEVAKKFNLNLVTQGVTSINEVSQAIDALLEKVDTIITPTDNTVASSIKLICSKCSAKKIPVIAFDKAHVEAGALATEGIDYYKLGFQTGLMAVDVLNGKKPNDMGIKRIDDTSLYVNIKTAEKLNITIPDDIKDKMIDVNGGEVK